MIARRRFLASLAGAAATARARETTAAPAGRRIAVTVDDLPAARRSFPTELLEDVGEFRKRNRNFLKAFEKRGASLAGFVTEGWTPANWDRDDLRSLLEDWLDAGAELGNHTYSHTDLYDVGTTRFQAEIVLGEAAIERGADVHVTDLRDAEAVELGVEVRQMNLVGMRLGRLASAPESDHHHHGGEDEDGDRFQAGERQDIERACDDRGQDDAGHQVAERQPPGP